MSTTQAPLSPSSDPSVPSDAGAADEPTMPAPSGARSRRTLLRLVVGAVALTTLTGLGNFGDAPPTVAAGSCTGWTSKSVPPRTIRVLRTNSGRVQTVPFRSYVAEVMASGEWPSRLHRTTLEAGAVATKQYAWYYALKGHHRSGYRRNGRCYDVRDDTRDQLFRPDRARPTKRQLRAVAATWDLTLRKNGRFFLTGYRAGTASRCAADANGWKLYARSVQACAQKGWSRQRVQRAYLSPNLTFVWSSRVVPAVRRPRVRLRVGNRVPSETATVSWRAKTKASKVRRFEVQRRVGHGAWRRVRLESSTARRADMPVKRGQTARFRVRAVDDKGRRGAWAYSTKRKATLRGDVGRILEPAVRASGARPRAKLRFRGHAVALVATTGPGMGTARVLLNGRRVATVDLSSATSKPRTIVWARNLDGRRRGTISVVSSGGRVHFGGFLVLR